MKNITVTASPHPQSKDVTLISVKGFIDTNTAPEFDRTFQSVLGEKKFKLIVDLKDVNYISSAGWGIFVGEIKRIRNQNGDLLLAAMSPEVTETYELLQFSTILKSFPDVDQALQSGFGKGKASKVAKPTEWKDSKGTVKVGAKVSPTPQAVKSFDKPPLEKVPVPASTISPVPKSNWLGKVLKPWTWF